MPTPDPFWRRTPAAGPLPLATRDRSADNTGRMCASSLPPPILVADEDSLGQLVRALAPYPVVAIDTESNSLHAYRERVCLIQFSTAAADYSVDPIRLPG